MISIIAAMSGDRIIGKDGGIPWHIPEDLKHFKDTTMGKAVIMGRKTYESIPGSLPGRGIVVLTRKDNLMLMGVTKKAHTPREALEKAMWSDEIIIAGGESIYKLFMGIADRMYITRVCGSYEGDTYFPPIDWSKWDLQKDDTVYPEYSIKTYDRIW